jgi:hypothetical protein
MIGIPTEFSNIPIDLHLGGEANFNSRYKSAFQLMEIDMSYMNNQMEFRAPAGIQELSFDEIDEVNGGHPVLIGLALLGAVALGYLACDYIARNC